MKVKLTLENTKGGLRATIFEQKDEQSRLGRRSAFSVESVLQAKQRASAAARKHGLTQYSFVDRTRAKA